MARRHPHGIPPVQCVAHLKTGERCRRYATVGTTMCYMHGGANKTTIRKAQERVTIAQLLEADPRHPWQVVLDATHTMDAIMRNCRAEVLDGETIGLDQLDRLIGYAQAAHHMASVAINSKAAEKIALGLTQQIELRVETFMARMGALYDELGVTEPWRRYALEVTARALNRAAGAPDDALGDEPRQPEDPMIREHDDGRPYRDGVAAQAIDVGPGPGFGPHEAVDDTALSDRAGQGFGGPHEGTESYVAALNNDALRSLGEAVLDELERRGVNA